MKAYDGMVSPNERYLIHETPFSAFSVEFNPFDDKRIAVTSCQHFGIIGNGLLEIIERTGATGTFTKTKACKTNEGLFDCAWSEANPYQLVGGCGDGLLKLWDVRSNDAFPIFQWNGHSQEVSSVEWNVVNKHVFISSSWDGSAKIWNILSEAPETVIHPPSNVQCHSCVWHPSNPTICLATFANGKIIVGDSRTPHQSLSGNGEVELMTGDWDKYYQECFATGGANGTIYGWDMRRMDMPTYQIQAHRYSIRKLRFSPWRPGIMATTSYDMSVGLWDKSMNGPRGPLQRELVMRCQHHSEFTQGLCWSCFSKDVMCTSAWDDKIILWNVGKFLPGG